MDNTTNTEPNEKALHWAFIKRTLIGSHVGFRLQQKSMTLYDLEHLFTVLFLCYAYCDQTAEARIMQFLQRGRIACNAEHGNSVCLFVCPSHVGTLSRRMKIESCGLHCELAKTL